MKINPPPSLVRFVALNLHQSLHIKQHNYQHVKNACEKSPTGSVIFCGWHQSLFSILAPLHNQNIAALTSLSRDGTIIATYMESIGLHPIRGSSSRGGLKAAREIIKIISKDSYHGAITVDGPRGPFKVCKPGPFEIARRTGAPIVPVACRASREFVFKKSWDHFRLPLPFSRLAVNYGQPWYIDECYPDEDTQERRCRLFERHLHALEDDASTAITLSA